MILQFSLISLFSKPRPVSPAPPTVEVGEPSRASILVHRIVKIVLAIYLIPALLIVLLVGVVGMLVLGVARLFSRLLDAGPK